MSGTGGLLGVWLLELQLGDNHTPEVVLSVFAEDTLFDQWIGGDTMRVGVNPVIEFRDQGYYLRLDWQLGDRCHRQIVDLADPVQRDLLKRLAGQSVLPVVLGSPSADMVEVYDCDNMFRSTEAPPPRMTIRMRHGHRHSHTWPRSA